MYVYGKHTIAVTPSETVKELMEEKSMTRDHLAHALRLSDEETDKFLDDYLPMTDSMAYLLHMEFGPSATFWKNLERIFLEDNERIQYEI